MRRARLRHDEFARSLATRLSIYLRTEIGIQMRTLHTPSHGRFMDSLPQPGHFTLVRLYPLSGLGLVAIPPRLALGLVDRMLGGAGHPPEAARELSEIETAVLDLITTLVLKEWCQGLGVSGETNPDLMGHETSSRFLPAAPRQSTMLQVLLEMQIGELTEAVHLAFPFAMVESLLRRTDSNAPLRTTPEEAPAAPIWNPALDEVKIPLSAQWHGLSVSARQLAGLQVGDVIPLPPAHFSDVEVRLAHVKKFSGRLGRANDLRAVELTGPAAP
jgi:flagellar motor switch protein FliM